MPHWMLKAALQKTLDLLPGGPWLYRATQPWLSHHLHEVFLADRLDHVQRHLAAWTAWHPDRLPRTVLELGTGWCPVVPLGLWLCGLARVDTCDLRLMVRTPVLERLRATLLQWQETGQLQAHLPGLRPARVQALRDLPPGDALSPAAWLARLDIHWHPLPVRGPAELLISNNTFEHIPAGELDPLLGQLWAAVAPGGVMSHYIDLVDHYAYTDPRLSRFHFLRYSPRQWAWYQSRFQVQNRLRLPQYTARYQQAGIPLDQVHCERGEAAELAGLPLHPDYAGVSQTDLLVTYAHLISHRRP